MNKGNMVKQSLKQKIV